MITTRVLVALAAAVLSAQLAFHARAEDWPTWRGPNGTGITSERSGWPNGWPPKRLWGANVGAGCTSPIIAAGSVFTMGWTNDGRGTDTIYCFDAASGREIWKQSYRCPQQGRVRIGDTDAYAGPSSTPTFDAAAGLLYTLSIDGDLRCWSAADNGRLVWAVNLYEQFNVGQRPDSGGGQRDFGYCSSPLLHGDQLIVEVGSTTGTVIAFDKTTGKQLWASEYNRPAGHSGGIVSIKIGGLQCLALLTLFDLVVMRADAGFEGRTVATVHRPTHFACNIPTPAAADGCLAVTSGYSQHSTSLIEFTPAGPVEKWNAGQHAVVSSPVIFGKTIYLINGALNALELQTGQRNWCGGGFGHGSCLATAGDSKLVVFGNRRLALVDAARELREYRELGQIDTGFAGTCYPHVALSDGIICCKDRDGNLACFSVRGE